MKREGRQHGVVTSHQILPAALSRQRFVKMVVDSSAVTGIFTKVPSKPTNQSKFTGKCRRPRCNGCHIHPACKSKDKTKGTMKLRSIDAGKKLTKYFSGSSVTGVLAYLDDESGYDDGHDYDDNDYDYQGIVEENYDYAYSYGHAYDDDHDDDDDDTHDIDLRVGFGIGVEEHEIDVGVGEMDVEEDDDDGEIDVDDDGEIDVEDDDDDDDNMSFCDVGLCWGHGDGDEYGDDDGWYMVGGEMQ